MIRASMSLSTRSGGTAIPVPASTARASAIGRPPENEKRLLRGGFDPVAQPRVLARDVEDGQVPLLDEPVARLRPLAVEPRRRRRGVAPDLDRRPVREGRQLVIGLARRAVEDVDRAAVGVAAAEARLGELPVGLRGALVERLAQRVAGAGRRIAARPEALDERLGLRVVGERQVLADLLGGRDAGDRADQPARVLGAERGVGQVGGGAGGRAGGAGEEKDEDGKDTEDGNDEKRGGNAAGGSFKWHGGAGRGT